MITQVGESYSFRDARVSQGNAHAEGADETAPDHFLYPGGGPRGEAEDDGESNRHCGHRVRFATIGPKALSDTVVFSGAGKKDPREHVHHESSARHLDARAPDKPHDSLRDTEAASESRADVPHLRSSSRATPRSNGDSHEWLTVEIRHRTDLHEGVFHANVGISIGDNPEW